MNKLAAFELPLLVREVEVDAATMEDSIIEEAAPAADATTADSPAASVVLAAAPPPAKSAAKAAPKAPTARTPTVAPIVSKPLSKYTVTVEFVELVTPPPAPAEAAVPAPSS